MKTLSCVVLPNLKAKRKIESTREEQIEVIPQVLAFFRKRKCQQNLH